LLAAISFSSASVNAPTDTKFIASGSYVFGSALTGILLSAAYLMQMFQSPSRSTAPISEPRAFCGSDATAAGSMHLSSPRE